MSKEQQTNFYTRNSLIHRYNQGDGEKGMANCESQNDDKIKDLTTRLDSIERLNKRNDDAR